MVIKTADDKGAGIRALRASACRPGITVAERRRIERDVRMRAAGIRGEREAAYHIDLALGESRNWVVLHDLRLIVEGHAMQLDHVIINRFLELWICETKHFSESVAINDRGEFSITHQGRVIGVRSPLAQNREHARLLKRFFSVGTVKLPTRMGLPMKPVIRSVVLVSNCAQISRPLHPPKELESLMKAEQFDAFIDAEIDRIGNPLVIAKLISTATLERFARSLSAAHAPAPRSATPKPVGSGQVFEGESEIRDRPKAICASCGREGLSERVARYCNAHSKRFGGRILCFDCQRSSATATWTRPLVSRPVSAGVARKGCTAEA